MCRNIFFQIGYATGMSNSWPLANSEEGRLLISMIIPTISPVLSEKSGAISRAIDQRLSPGSTVMLSYPCESAALLEAPP